MFRPSRTRNHVAETREGVPSITATVTSVVTGIGGDYELHAAPQVLAAAAFEAIQGMLRLLKALPMVPPDAEGELLQPQRSIHFGPEV
jgi:hypothetical protein